MALPIKYWIWTDRYFYVHGFGENSETPRELFANDTDILTKTLLKRLKWIHPNYDKCAMFFSKERALWLVPFGISVLGCSIQLKCNLMGNSLSNFTINERLRTLKGAVPAD